MSDIPEFFPIEAAYEMSQGDPSCLDRDDYDRTARAEMYVVGGMMLNYDHAREGVRILSESDFYGHHTRIVFNSVRRILSENRAPSMEAVFDDLTRMNLRDEFINGTASSYLSMCFRFCVAAVDFVYKAGVIRDMAAKRLMKRIAAEMIGQCESREPSRDIASRYARTLGEVADLSPGSELIPMPASTIATSRSIEAAHMHKGEPARRTGITTGVNAIDGIIPSIEPGELMILAARPGVGKSALAALIARNVAFLGGKVLFFSLEMPHVQLTTRILAMTSGVSLPALRGHRDMSEAEKDTVFRTLNTELSQLPIHYCDRRGITAEQVASESRRPSLVVVDYLQLLRADRGGDNRNYQIGAMTKTLRNVAGEIGSPMIVLAQMNRQSESESREPKLSDLRDSGEIEQDADIVAFLHLAQTATSDKAEIDVSFIVAKQRQGTVGKVELTYTRRTTCFSDRTVPM